MEVTPEFSGGPNVITMAPGEREREKEREREREEVIGEGRCYIA